MTESRTTTCEIEDFEGKKVRVNLADGRELLIDAERPDYIFIEGWNADNEEVEPDHRATFNTDTDY